MMGGDRIRSVLGKMLSVDDCRWRTAVGHRLCMVAEDERVDCGWPNERCGNEKYKKKEKISVDRVEKEWREAEEWRRGAMTALYYRPLCEGKKKYYVIIFGGKKK